MRAPWSCGAVALVAILTVGCGPDPEKAGDECDPGDGCPEGLVCAPLGEDDICQIPPGAGCDPAAEADYCLGDAICGPVEGGGVCGIPEGGACDPAASYCAGDLVCAELQAGGNVCYPPVQVRGMVFDAMTTAGIAGAHVLALDEQAAATSDVAVSDAAGNYELDIAVARDDSGAPIGDVFFTLRGSAQDYQTFPGGIRRALPINSTEAVAEAGGWVIDTAVTDIALIALPAAEQGLPSIAGTVLAGAESGGVLVVAEDDAGGAGHSAISDASGAYTIFNVPNGSYTVSGYAANIQLTPATAAVAGAPLTGVDLALGAEALGTVNGSVQIVNGGGGTATSIVLVVDSTFNETFFRGEVPRGLRTPLTGPPDVTGAFSIVGVPAGDYVVLAAFENDLLVRDPDLNIAGTGIQRITMPRPGTVVDVVESFKITGALEVLMPGASDPEAVSGSVTLSWVDDSSEDFYTVVVFDAFGDVVWCQADAGLLPEAPAMCDGPNVPSVSGGDVTVAYGGPLDPGMYYQFRATSWRAPGGNASPISQTEDLLGVFFVPLGM